jgi:hypothetical protein
VTVLITPETRLECPNCGHTEIDRSGIPPLGATSQRFHACSSLAGITAPLVVAGTRCKIEAHEREDYIGPTDIVTLDGNGRPIMAVSVTRDDGNDRIVFAPCATVKLA